MGKTPNHQARHGDHSRGSGCQLRILMAVNASFYAALVLGSKPSTTLALTQAAGAAGEVVSRFLFASMAINALLLVLQCFSVRMRTHTLSFLPMFFLGLTYLLIAGVANDLNATTVYTVNILLLGAVSIWGALTQLVRR